MLCNTSPSAWIEICNKKTKRTRLIPKGLLVASNIQGYTLRKQKGNPTQHPPNTKKR